MKVKNINTVIITTLALVVAVIAPTNAQVTPKSESPVVTISHNKKLIKSDDGNVDFEDGNCIVFEIKTTNGGDPRIDAQITTTLIFDIPENLDQFEFNDSDLKERQAYILISECRCMDRGYNPIVSGVLKGKKMEDGKWQIEADLIAKGIDSGEDRLFKYNGLISSDK